MAQTMDTLLALLGQLEPTKRLGEMLEANQSPTCAGVTGSARLLLAEHVARIAATPVIWISPTNDGAERLAQDLRIFLGDDGVLHFPERDEAPVHGGHPVADPMRLQILEEVERGRARLVVTSVRALLQKTLAVEKLMKGRIVLKKGEMVDLETLLELLTGEGYVRLPMVERRGEFSLRGGILDLFPVTGEPVRIELFGDEIESMRRFDKDTQRSISEVDEVVLLPAQESDDDGGTLLTDHLPRGSVACLEEPAQIKLHAMEWAHEGWEGEWGDFLGLLSPLRQVCFLAGESPDGGHLEFPFEPAAVFSDRVDGFMNKLPYWQDEGKRVLLVSLQTARLKELVAERQLKIGSLDKGSLCLVAGSLSEGFRLGDLEVLSDREVMHATRRRRATRKADRASLLRLEELEVGVLVVHLQHGLGRYLGVRSLVVQGNARDFLALEYAKGDSVYVPVEQLDLVQKYQGLEDRVAKLSKMGGQEWARAKGKVKEDADKLAAELLKLYAQREMAVGYAFPPDTPWQTEMEEAFPWQETDDQLRVIGEVKHDLEQGRPMDRLVCGDVGYGKTEVALRAGFKAAVEGRQVAVLVPTTVLAQQHFQTFSERLAPFPVKVEMMSRFRSAKEQKATLERLVSGECDIVVGTHRLLSKDIKYKNLGLLIIDEEHRFGVKQKERIKDIRKNVDVLAMTATPIPRTLNMALSGIRDMSVIETPPEDRIPIKTYLFEHHPDVLKGALTRELAREGQVFVVHNRIEDIERLAQDLRRLVPNARIAVGHGQMDEGTLEKLLMDFFEHEYDVLVSTTIIESGVDIPNVNTIIINNAHHFGLAQLYQLRGRVGRSNRQAYCYLLYPPHRQLNEDAIKRLETIRDFTYLGAGFQIALRDLEIRGAGDILGAEQSGSIAAVGFDLYCRMLAESVKTMRGEKPEAPPEEETSVVVDLPVPACLPESYVEDSGQKVALYKKIAQLRHVKDLEAVRSELRDRFGPLPEQAENLLKLMEIRLLARDLMIPSIRAKEGKLTFLMPFYRPLTMKEKQKIFQLTNWKPMEVPKTLTLGNLFGVAAGPPIWPPAPELLSKVQSVLFHLGIWKTL